MDIFDVRQIYRTEKTHMVFHVVFSMDSENSRPFIPSSSNSILHDGCHASSSRYHVVASTIPSPFERVALELSGGVPYAAGYTSTKTSFKTYHFLDPGSYLIWKVWLKLIGFS